MMPTKLKSFTWSIAGSVESVTEVGLRRQTCCLIKAGWNEERGIDVKTNNTCFIVGLFNIISRILRALFPHSENFLSSAF